jgi:hypothetical protein
MNPALAVKRCSPVTAARAAYFLRDQDPERTLALDFRAA